ncbi:MAG: SDR family NAD(P)-dependent oxidoreductase [Mesorhizobium sp.]|uniref:SDR family NAD(P)-dependent oxidoreductase n=1 Tax=Mesorhizobium sp. TaxID=1871066 RepID=UPI001214F273|nr:SDR family NAD(P)-dependent oxidoreductase [Mesorhizobium sp.]TIR17062.1 MAG: SDR family NAD(P)-dependent oxidoreductase [Mesorhizobium sp.]
MEQPSVASGFGASSTAGEVLRGIDLRGKLAVVTGGYSGLGHEMTHALAGAGARVIVPARRPMEARATLANMAGVSVVEMDLADLDSVRTFARDLVEEGNAVDIVIANAGVMACPETRLANGWELQFAVNHLGHFVLVARLWPLLVKASSARVVVMSSGAHATTNIRWDDPHFDKGYDRWQAYGQSKTANILFAVGLDAIGKEHGIRAFAVHPGNILTPLQRHLTRAEMVEAGWVDENGRLVDPSFKTPEQGAATAVWAATSPQLEGRGGLYCEDCGIAPVATLPGESGVQSYALDPGSAFRLWRLSAKLTGDDPADIGVEQARPSR